MTDPTDLNGPIMRICAVTGDEPDELVAAYIALCRVGFTPEGALERLDDLMDLGEKIAPRVDALIHWMIES